MRHACTPIGVLRSSWTDVPMLSVRLPGFCVCWRAVSLLEKWRSISASSAWSVSARERQRGEQTPPPTKQPILAECHPCSSRAAGLELQKLAVESAWQVGTHNPAPSSAQPYLRRLRPATCSQSCRPMRSFGRAAAAQQAPPWQARCCYVWETAPAQLPAPQRERAAAAAAAT